MKLSQKFSIKVESEEGPIGSILVTGRQLKPHNQYCNLSQVDKKLRGTYSNIAQLGGAAEYTNCISALELETPPKKCPGYDTKPSALKNVGNSFIVISSWSTFNLEC